MKPASRALSDVPFLSYGFRPFFLGGAVWAAVAMAIWIGALAGEWEVASAYGAVAWHAHEFLFGYVGAVITGFLLTAIPNWTGRLPVRGAPLLGLFVLWLAGRLALLFSDQVGVVPAATVDSLFLVTLALVILREIIAGRNWRNLPVVVLVSLVSLADIAFNVEVIVTGVADYSVRAAIALVLVLIMLIGGRIVPSFTRNWLAKRGVERLPSPFGRFDVAAVAVSAMALATWVVWPEADFAGAMLILAGAVQFVRLLRWRGWPTWREPLVHILHAGYAFVPIGFVAVGVSALRPEAIPPSGALHLWTAGAMVLMTLAVMTRATLGHTGRDLTAGLATRIVYLAALIAVLGRFAAPLAIDVSTGLLYVAAAAWLTAFGGFALWFGPMLARRKASG